jgi:hypothetical protein
MSEDSYPAELLKKGLRLSGAVEVKKKQPEKKKRKRAEKKLYSKKVMARVYQWLAEHASVYNYTKLFQHAWERAQCGALHDFTIGLPLPSLSQI